MSSKAWRALIAGFACVAFAASVAHAYSLEEIQQKGRVRIALYKNFWPFSQNNKGIDVDIAKSLANKLNVALDIMWLEADENMEDDLRNAIWKGHYLGGGTADVMLHVPAEPEFAKRNDKVKIFAPYYQEKIQIARNTARVPELVSMEQLVGEKIAVEVVTAADAFLLGALGGRLRSNVVHFRTAAEAMTALREGKVSAVMGPRSDLEAGLVGADKEFQISTVQAPGLSLSGWNVGIAVAADNEALAAVLDRAIGEMRASGQLTRIFESHGISYDPPVE